MTLPRGRSGRDGKRGHVVDYRHVIHALKRKPAALLNLAYREQLFPRDAYRHMFDHLLARTPERSACRTMVALLLLAHERGCEAELAELLEADRAAGQLPDIAGLRTRFGPGRVAGHLCADLGRPLAAYQDLLDDPDSPAITPAPALEQEHVE
jgi:hypothetical protein